ncbi:MAG: diacylglycerol kinase, partial [Bacteroidetes bacterium HGW-Bacteroidetes-22]
IVAAVLAVGLGFIFRITQGEWLAVILSIVAVIAAEAFNTSIEKLTDIVSPEFNREAGKVKDIAAAAVLIISLGALVVGTVVFLPLILNLF